MGIDAKGRNFSAPRLTPGRKHELMTYGSPAMIKDQDHQIAIMNDRARRYGYAMNSAASVARYGGTTARALGTNEGYYRPLINARPITTTASQQSVKSAIKAIIIVILFFNILPILIAIISVISEAIEGLD
jgi:hypothetical protein